MKHHGKITSKDVVKVLKVSRSRFYEYRHRRPSKQQVEREVLSEKIKSIFHEHKGCYAKGIRYKYKHYNRKGASLSRSNLILIRSLKKQLLNKVWLGDVTYIPSKEGTLYLAVNIDIFSRKIIGWSMSSRMQDKLVMDRFLQACGKERPQSGVNIRALVINPLFVKLVLNLS